MKLENIAIQEFKQFAGRLFIDELQPGLNLFVGPNETGKSTIAEAVRTVFLERYKASHLKDLLPWSKAGGQPGVEITFSLNGVPCSLSKQFVARQRCDLRIGHDVFKEDEAEEKLAELLGFSRAARGAMKAEQAGVPGLLWVQQGETQEVHDSSGHAAQYLRDALAQLSGSRASAGEDALITAVQRELAQLLTERTRRPTGALAEAEQALAALYQDRDELEGQRQQFDDDVARLAAQQEAFDDAQRKRPWDALEQKAIDAQKRSEAIAELERTLSGLGQSVQLSQAELALSLQQEQAAAELESSIAKDRQQLEEARASVLAAQSEHALAVEAVAKCQHHHDETNRALELANAAVTATDLRSQIALNEAEIERLTSAIGSAEAASQLVQESARAAAAAEVNADKLQQLQSLTQRVALLRARKEAALTRIEYRLSGTITIDGKPVQGEGTLLVESEKSIGLPGLGELSVIPGVSDVSALSAELDELEIQHALIMQGLGVTSLTEAQDRHEQWKTLVAFGKRQSDILAVHAPKGIEPLREAMATAVARLKAAQDRLGVLPDVAAAPDLAHAKHEAVAARVSLEQARHQQVHAGEKKSTAMATTETISSALQRKAAQLQDETFRQKRFQWQASLVEQRARVGALTKELEARTREVELAKADDPAAEAKRYRDSAALARSDQHERQMRTTRLRSQLETMGASGLGERLAKAHASIEQWERRKSELSLRANALSMLDTVLVEERDAAVAQLRAPLTDRLGHYLKRIFPQAEMSVSDELSPIALHRYGRVDMLGALSFGTREQLGILARLAYADLLKASGRPTLLILDDAAVHTDGARRDAIKRALIDAATRHQILLFTCHPEAWDDLGVKQRAIDDLKAAA